MPAKPVILNIVFTLLAGLGLLMALLGLGMDILLGTHPGLNLPQLLLIAGGLSGSLVAFRLRRGDARRRVWASIREHWRVLLVTTALTVLALELALAAAGINSYLPHIPGYPLEETPGRICDELGCRFDQGAMDAACENGEMTGRYCTVNRQGFHDRQDFAVGADFDERLRILMLGDSFAFGMSAEIGRSYVETIESNLPQAIVWNTGIPGVGTQHALRLFQAYAPLLQPQITILGFYMNDFEDNILPIDLWILVGGAMVQQYHLDDQGNITKLDLQAAYYHAFGVTPTTNEIQRLVSLTRLGSLALKAVDIARIGRRAASPPEWLQLSGSGGGGIKCHPRIPAGLARCRRRAKYGLADAADPEAERPGRRRTAVSGRRAVDEGTGDALSRSPPSAGCRA